MKNRNKIIYWITTIFLSIGMTAGGAQQMLQIGGYNEIVSSLGYPLYLLSIIGTWKILGVIAILIPKFPLLKEWAYAGFFFAMSGAFISHLAVGQAFSEAVPSLILLTVTVLSWYLRPADRKINLNKN
ncbi:MAG TPA: DoxX family protein [Flavobacterium sp.]|nr:DoxX family protein [Flavobacterium sp.]